MEVLHIGIAQSFKVSPLKSSKTYYGVLHHPATNTSITMTGYFVGSNCYFYLDSTNAKNLKAGNYNFNVYDDKRQDICYCENFAVVRMSGIVFQS